VPVLWALEGENSRKDVPKSAGGCLLSAPRITPESRVRGKFSAVVVDASWDRLPSGGARSTKRLLEFEGVSVEKYTGIAALEALKEPIES